MELRAIKWLRAVDNFRTLYYMDIDALASILGDLQQRVVDLKVRKARLQEELSLTSGELNQAETTLNYLQALRDRMKAEIEQQLKEALGRRTSEGRPSYPSRGVWLDKIRWVVRYSIGRYATNEDVVKAIEQFEPDFRKESIPETLSRLTEDDPDLTRTNFGIRGRRIKAVGLKEWGVRAIDGKLIIPESRWPVVSESNEEFETDDLPF